MAAGYTLKELMELMGHADLQMVNRYVKLLPQPGEEDLSERLNHYLRRAAEPRPYRFSRKAPLSRQPAGVLLAGESASGRAG